MQFIIYCRFKEPSLLKGVSNALNAITETYVSGDIVFVSHESSPRLSEKNVVRCIQDYLHSFSLDSEDIVYVFYPQFGDEIRMYPLKRKGRVRLNTWPKEL